MPFEVNWYHEKRVILARIQGDLTMQDLLRYSDAVYEMIDLGVAPTHLIVDATKIGQFPASLGAVKNAGRYLQHPKTGWNVMIGGPIVAQVFGGVITRLAKIDYRSARTMEEAIQVLVEVDPSLAGLKDHSR
jgi:hypothetical protein